MCTTQRLQEASLGLRFSFSSVFIGVISGGIRGAESPLLELFITLGG